jgi:hypothetical protein
MTELKHLILDYRNGELVVRALYLSEAHEAAMAGDKKGYLEALRSYMKAGRDEALRIRRGAA